MRLREVCVATLSVLVLSACAQMDEPGSGFDRQVSAIAVDQTTGQTYQVTVHYDSGVVTADEAQVLVHNVGVTHDDGITPVQHDPLISPNGVMAESPHWQTVDPSHGFYVTVSPDGDLNAPQVDMARWQWVELNVAALVMHCPPGHAGRTPAL